MKTAIIHYWLTGMGGGEKVLEALCRIWPQADLFTHALDRRQISPFLASRRIQTTFIQRLPFAGRLYQRYLPLMPLALEQLDLRGYDLVISSESGPAKGVLTRADAAHICYCHTPMRYLWDFYPDYLAQAGFFTRLCMRPLFHYLRLWDAASAQRVDAIAANSHTVAARIRKHWRREACVIHPPVDAAAVMAAHHLPDVTRLKETYGAFYLFAGRLVSYKRADLAIIAAARLGRPLLVIGDGPARPGLERLARDLGAAHHIHFTGRVDTPILHAAFHACQALLFPGEEDFGIVPLEAQAAGTPVIAFGRGGALETVHEGTTGLFFTEQTPDSLTDAIRRFEASRPGFAPEAIRAWAARFSEDAFARAFSDLAHTTLEKVRAGTG